MYVYAQRNIRVQNVNEERVVLQEVISLETAAVTDPKVREKLAVVGC